MSIAKGKNIFHDPKQILFSMQNHNMLNWIPDSIFLKIFFRLRLGKKLNLKSPQTFNEKLQWLKLYDRKPEYTMMVDKYEVKKYVASKIGEQYIIPSFGIWECFDDIPFEILPNQFVLKCTHDSGGLVICKDKNNWNIEEARYRINKALKKNFFYHGREWPYKNVKPRILAEQYINDGKHIVPEDYKIYCMNGEPKYIVVFHNRFHPEEALSESVYDTNWNKLNISLDEHFQISDRCEPRPACFEELIKICKILCKDMIQVRIDFYIIDNKIYFGEITLFTANGMQKMIPEEMDAVLGNQLKLPGERG